MENRKVIFICLTATILNCASALAAEKVLNGGDICEDRFKVVRDDIRAWIQAGGSAGLQLPKGVTLQQYNDGMNGNMAAAHVSCVERPVTVAGVEKTCVNANGENGVPSIVCNATRFKNTSTSDQYVLVHHEYAGLAGLEVNDDESSVYVISNQITEFLANQFMKRLSVRRQTPQAPNGIKAAFSDFIGTYRIVSCEMSTKKDKSKSICDGHKTAELKFYYTRPDHNSSLVLSLPVRSGYMPDRDGAMKIAVARDHNEIGSNCSTSYGRQFCEGAFIDGSDRHYVAHFTIRTIGNLTYADWSHIPDVGNDGVAINSISFVLEKQR